MMWGSVSLGTQRTEKSLSLYIYTIHMSIYVNAYIYIHILIHYDTLIYIYVRVYVNHINIYIYKNGIVLRYMLF